MRNKKVKAGAGIGIGYASIMMIFAVICLTTLAVLSLRASDSGRALTGKSSVFTCEYYSADLTAKEILMKLDSAAYGAHASGFFDDDFPGSELPAGIALSPVPEGYRADYAVKINDKLDLSVSVLFFSEPRGQRYRIEKWKTMSESDNDSGSHLSVWDGETF